MPTYPSWIQFSTNSEPLATPPIRTLAADAGIRLAESVPQDMVAVPCGADSRFIVVGSPHYFASASLPWSPSDLLKHECIRRRMPSGKLYHREFEKRGDEIAVDVPGRLTLDNDALMVEAALEGLGLAFVSDFWVSEHLAAKTLQAVLEDWTPPFPGLCLYYPGHRHMTAGLRAFVDMLREERKVAANGKANSGAPEFSPHPEERPVGRVSKDGRNAEAHGHPSRRAKTRAPQDEVRLVPLVVRRAATPRVSNREADSNQPCACRAIKLSKPTSATWNH
jgi:LysR substrate binding domain-containing protein